MEIWRLLLLFFLAFHFSRGIEDCPSIQYIEMKSTGTIQCSFEEGFFGVIWYNSTDLFHDEAVLTMKNSIKSGKGFTSGKLDIFPNGSLIVYNVSVKDEANYTVIKLETKQKKNQPYVISVSVIAHSLSNQPEIDFCENNDDICFQTSSTEAQLSCSIRDSRPAIPVKWMARTIRGDKNMSSYLRITSEANILFTSRATAKNPFIYCPFLTLLVCKGENSNSPLILGRNESLVIVLNNDESLMRSSPLKVQVQMGSVLTLNCTNNHISYLVWQLKTILNTNFRNVILTHLESGVTKNYEEQQYKLTNTGSLVLHDIGIQHEGTYRCISGNGYENHMTLYHVTVFVPASPAYVVVEGCRFHPYCVLHVQPEGTLTCSLKRIRPEVELDFKYVFGPPSTSLTIYNKQLVVKSNEEYFDISLTLQYDFTGAGGSRVTVECIVKGTDIEKFNLSTKFDLVFSFAASETTTTAHNSPFEGSTYWIILSVMLVLLLLIAFSALFCFKANRRKNRKVLTTPEEIPMVSTIDSPGNILKRELRAKYKDLYDGIQPIPYIHDRLYCVDKVFVEGGIEYMVARIVNKDIWDDLSSYINILGDDRVNSKRRILEGEPGYGKSTVLLQLAHDWCNEIPNSHLEKTDILILLRLRQLGGVTSIYKAIKRFLLPQDSILTEDDIEHIIRTSSSVVALLDGYDEYPDQDTDFDVIKIIKHNMFQQVDVIVTTRSKYLPKGYPAMTKRLRLTGFDDKARGQYIRKAVVGDDTNSAEKIINQLKENPVLKDLCQVPLFFVMFAHMSHENENFGPLTSVTSFFKYTISCFHSHTQNKERDENVLQEYVSLEKDHHKLDQLAFDALNRPNTQIVWTKKDMCLRLGNGFYKQYVRIGILREEKVLDNTDNSEIIRYTTEVRFYHKLFCEWYAAYYLSEYASRDDVTFYSFSESDQSSINDEDSVFDVQQNSTTEREHNDFFKYLDPFELQYLYRFACGLDSKAAEKIIEYLRSRKDTLKFAILCLLERKGNVEEVLHDIEDFCSTAVYISRGDSFLLQRSTIQLLQIAETSKIDISSLYLSACFKAVGQMRNSIQLKSDIYLPCISTIMKLEIWEPNRAMTLEEVEGIFQYASECVALRELHFIDCLLPQCFTDGPPPAFSLRHVGVTWFAPIGDYYLELKTWKHKQNKKGSLMSDEDYQREVGAFSNSCEENQK